MRGIPRCGGSSAISWLEIFKLRFQASIFSRVPISDVLLNDNGGNVGIGTSNAYYELDFGRNATGGTSSDYGGMLAVYNNGGNYLHGIDADNYGSGYYLIIKLLLSYGYWTIW